MAHHRIVIGVAALCAAGGVVAVAGVGWARGGEPRPASGSPTSTATVTMTPVPTVVPTPAPTPVLQEGLIDGVPMDAMDWDARRALAPLAIMVDNASPSFPQYGLGQADLVFEALVEGGLTRFMAVYWRREVARVEPIRSARTPFVTWASELGAFYAHAGGAETANLANAIGQIREWAIPDLDALLPSTAGGFYRDQGRAAPYNLATSTQALRDLATSLRYPVPTPIAAWRFKDELTGTRSAPTAGAFELGVGPRRTAGRLVQWRWDPATNDYLRSQWGVPHVDAATGEQLRFKTIVVMRVPWAVVDAGGHVLLTQMGEGPVSVFLDGRRLEGTWRKTSRTARTRFYDPGGVELALNRGPVFIQVIGPDGYLLAVGTPDDLPAIEPVPAGDPGHSAPPEEPSPDSQPSRTPVPSPGPAPSPTSSVPPTAAVATPSPPGTAQSPVAASPTSSPANARPTAASPASTAVVPVSTTTPTAGS